MEEINIAELLINNSYYTYSGKLFERYDLVEDIPDNKVIVGDIDTINIYYKYGNLDLSNVKCNKIKYFDQEEDSIKNHILPNSLKILICSNEFNFSDLGNRITDLPKLPNSLIELDCMFNRIKNLPKLPDCLIELYCNHNQLEILPELPKLLKKLRCNNNQLKLLPELPNSLKELFCYNNQLKLLPKLPNSLEMLFCYKNQIEELPMLTNSLKNLYCDNNKIRKLPILPNSLKIFRIGNTILDEI